MRVCRFTGGLISQPKFSEITVAFGEKTGKVDEDNSPIKTLHIYPWV